MVSLGDIGCHIVEEIIFHCVGKLGVYWVYLILRDEIILLIPIMRKMQERYLYAYMKWNWIFF